MAGGGRKATALVLLVATVAMLLARFRFLRRQATTSSSSPSKVSKPHPIFGNIVHNDLGAVQPCPSHHRRN